MKSLLGKTFGAIRVQMYKIVVDHERMILTQNPKLVG